MTAQRYRRCLLSLLLVTIIVAVIAILLVASGTTCKHETCVAFGIVLVGYLLLACLLCLVLATIMLAASIRRSINTGLGSAIAIAPVFFLAELPVRAWHTWRIATLVPTFDRSQLILSTALYAGVAAALLILLSTTATGALKDARASFPAPFYVANVSAILLLIGFVPDLLYDLAFSPIFMGSFSFQLIFKLSSLRAYWFVAAQIAFIASTLLLVWFAGTRPPPAAESPSNPQGNSPTFGRRQR